MNATSWSSGYKPVRSVERYRNGKYLGVWRTLSDETDQPQHHKRRDVLIAVVTTTATIIAACIVLVAIILLAIVLTDQPPMEKPRQPTVTPTSTAPLPL
jgi:hypothetical protein